MSAYIRTTWASRFLEREAQDLRFISRRKFACIMHLERERIREKKKKKIQEGEGYEGEKEREAAVQFGGCKKVHDILELNAVRMLCAPENGLASRADPTVLHGHTAERGSRRYLQDIPRAYSRSLRAESAHGRLCATDRAYQDRDDYHFTLSRSDRRYPERFQSRFLTQPALPQTPRVATGYMTLYTHTRVHARTRIEL